MAVDPQGGPGRHEMHGGQKGGCGEKVRDKKTVTSFVYDFQYRRGI